MELGVPQDRNLRRSLQLMAVPSATTAGELSNICIANICASRCRPLALSRSLLRRRKE
jgi:hypothetical protein